MSAPTVQMAARAVLRDWGILYLDNTSPASQTNKIRALDLDAAALVLSQTFQTIAAKSQSELKTQPGSGMLHAPTAVTVTATNGSNTISALTTYASWMLGCTIRIAGDSGDNEILSSTLLARTYVGTGGAALNATVYGDAITLPESVGKVLSPMVLQSNLPISEATSRHEFLTCGGFRLPAWYEQRFAYYPFAIVSQKALEDFPLCFFVDAYYDPTLEYTVRRVRFSPMPNVAQSVGWTSTINPQRVVATDIDGGTHVETNVLIPSPNGWVESIFIPIARQIGSGCPQFKNETIRAEIKRQYDEALNILSGANGSAGRAKTGYL